MMQPAHSIAAGRRLPVVSAIFVCSVFFAASCAARAPQSTPGTGGTGPPAGRLAAAVTSVSAKQLEVGEEKGEAGIPAELKRELDAALGTALNELSRIFDAPLEKSARLDVYSAAKFDREIGRAGELNALYRKNRIVLAVRRPVNRRRLIRTIRHEAAHAAVAQLAGDSCPAWVEEGFAQIFEGRPPPRLAAELRTQLKSGTAPLLSELQNSFAGLNSESQAAAYALSRFAVRSLLLTRGSRMLRSFLSLYQETGDYPTSFRQAFGIPLREFEQQLAAQLERWAASDLGLE